MRRFLGRRRKLNHALYEERWQALQQYCSTRKTWPQAIVEADKLMDETLKRRGYKGKTTGARLVAAQHSLTKNDMVWLGHKLRNRIVQGDVDVRRLKKRDVLGALSGFRQALRDLGALEES